MDEGLASRMKNDALRDSQSMRDKVARREKGGHTLLCVRLWKRELIRQPREKGKQLRVMRRFCPHNRLHFQVDRQRLALCLSGANGARIVVLFERHDAAERHHNRGDAHQHEIKRPDLEVGAGQIVEDACDGGAKA